jgi:sterol desaturase/sphingolipid hydroxylase (fatty acid hydroxylase superfamily)
MLAVALGAVAGAATWSLLEYLIHRFAGHVRTNNIFGVEHTAHHSRGDYFAPAWKKVAAAVGVAAIAVGPAVLVGGLWPGLAYVAGLSGFYLYYEILHRLEHVWGGWGPYARWARAHHFHHHFHDPSVNHGVTSPIWDMVFGTYVRPGVIRVPQKLAMGWLIDPETGDIHEQWQGRYELRRRRVAKAS